MNTGKLLEKIHFKCRNSVYPGSSLSRFPVPDEKVSWDVEWSDYKPVAYTSPKIQNQSWADPHLGSPSFQPLWNDFDALVNRKSYVRQYQIVNGFPLNPIGRTGVTGRGILGRWGPNHAADPILTRWKKNSKKLVERDKLSGKPILQFVGIKRKDCQEWAIPGGMIDPGETVTDTLKREFMEEALNILSENEERRIEKKKLIEKLFNNGVEIYKGYVDDPRNTDNAWMETIATNFHDNEGTYLDEINLEAGDDAFRVKWIDISSSLTLFASHSNFLFNVAKIRGSHW